MRKGCRWWDSMKFDVGFEVHHGGMSTARAWWTVLSQAVWHYVVAKTICRLKGHKWEQGEGFCSPDSGYESIECARCGEYHGSYLY